MNNLYFTHLKSPTWATLPDGFPGGNSTSNSFHPAVACWDSLPCEIVDIILHYVESDTHSLLVCKYWYHVLVKRQMRIIDVSAKMVVDFPFLNENLQAMMAAHTHEFNIRLGRQSESLRSRSFQRRTQHTVSNHALNNGLLYIANKFPTFGSLKCFGFYNYMETQYSWNTVYAATFEHLLKKLASYPFDQVTIDHPGAIFETRSKMHSVIIPEPHCCDLFRINFPDVKFLHLRMREICPLLFKVHQEYTRLERVLIFLDLNYEVWQELDIDISAVHCWDYEMIGKYLAKEMEQSIKNFMCSPLTPKLKSVELRYPVFEDSGTWTQEIARYYIEGHECSKHLTPAAV